MRTGYSFWWQHMDNNEEQKYKVIDYQGRPARLYPDGSIRNERGHMLAPLPGGAPPISSANARALADIRNEQRRRLMREAANAAVQRADFAARYGGDAYLAEMAYAAQIKATTIDDPKMIEAARWLTQMTGEADEAGGGDGAGIPLAEWRGLLRDIADAARAVAAAQDRR